MGWVHHHEIHHHLGVSKNRGTPKWMVYNGKPLLKWMIWGVFPLFLETPIWENMFEAFSKHGSHANLSKKDVFLAGAYWWANEQQMAIFPTKWRAKGRNWVGVNKHLPVFVCWILTNQNIIRPESVVWVGSTPPPRMHSSGSIHEGLGWDPGILKIQTINGNLVVTSRHPGQQDNRVVMSISILIHGNLRVPNPPKSHVSGTPKKSPARKKPALLRETNGFS